MNKILIIGGGSIGKRHLRNLLSLGESNITLVETNPERHMALSQEFSGVKLYTTLDVAWEGAKYNIAFVCSPSIFHSEQAIFCARRGCHLFIEKPLAHNLAGVDELVKIVTTQKLITMVGSNWKFFPLFQKMKELLTAKTIGSVLSARCQFGQYLPDWHSWEDYRQGYSANKKLGGGILLDSHEFDYLTWFLGDVEKLACFADRVSNITVDTEDVAEVILKMKNGAICEIHQDYIQRFSQRNFEFFGELGTIVWQANLKKVLLQVKDRPEEEFVLRPEYNLNDMYVEEVRHFLKSVADRQETITPVVKGKKVLELIIAAKESSAQDSIVKI